MATEQIFKTANDGADFWRYNIGVNVIPADTRSKMRDDTKLKISWKQWQDKPIPEELHERWKQNGDFERLGVAVICGKVWHNKNKSDLFLCAIDCDNQIAIAELSKNGLDKIARHTLTEQHKDNPNKCHVYFYTSKPVTKKSSDSISEPLKLKIETNEIPAFEVKGAGEHGIMFVSPSIHESGQKYEILDCHTPMIFEHVEKVIDDICQKYNIPYLSIAQSGKAILPVSEMVKDDFVIHEGHNRHGAIMQYMESKRIRNPEFSDDIILALAKEFNQKHCMPPLDDNDPVWTREFNSAKKFSEPIIQKNAELKQLTQTYKNEDFALVAAEIKSRHDFITIKENDQVFIFNGKIYEPFGEQIIRMESHKLIPNGKKQTMNEIIDWIRRDETYRPMKEVYNNYIINTQSGIIDPDTLQVLPHGPQYYTLAMLPFKVDPSARNLKLWNHILTIIDPKDITLILELLWMLIGWRNPFKKMFVFKGPSNTQKTTLANIIELIVGAENFSHEKPEKYLGKDSRFTTSKFIGKRGNFGSELGNLTKEHIENQKALVGAEKQNTEKKHDNAEYIFDPEHFTFINTTNNLAAIYKSMDDPSVITRFQFLMFRNVLEDSAQDGDWLAKFFDNDTDKETAVSTIVNIMLNYKRAQKLNRIPKTKFSTISETKKILQDMKDPEEKYFDDNRLVKKHGEKLELERVKADFEGFVGYKVKNNQTMGYILQKNGYKTRQSNSKTWVLDTTFKDLNQGVLNFAE